MIIIETGLQFSGLRVRSKTGLFIVHHPDSMDKICDILFLDS